MLMHMYIKMHGSRYEPLREEVTGMKQVLKSNWFFLSMILGIVAGILVGITWKDAAKLAPLGTLFLNMMFCAVVPMVFFSISSSIANMKSRKRAGRLMVTTIITFMFNDGRNWLKKVSREEKREKI